MFFAILVQVGAYAVGLAVFLLLGRVIAQLHGHDEGPRGSPGVSIRATAWTVRSSPR